MRESQTLSSVSVTAVVSPVKVAHFHCDHSSKPALAWSVYHKDLPNHLIMTSVRLNEGEKDSLGRISVLPSSLAGASGTGPVF